MTGPYVKSVKSVKSTLGNKLPPKPIKQRKRRSDSPLIDQHYTRARVQSYLQRGYGVPRIAAAIGLTEDEVREYQRMIDQLSATRYVTPERLLALKAALKRFPRGGCTPRQLADALTGILSPYELTACLMHESDKGLIYFDGNLDVWRLAERDG